MSNTDFQTGQENVVRGNFRQHFLLRLAARFTTWRHQRQAVRELQAMSDSLLRDLGIERYEIEDVVQRGGDFTLLQPVHKQPAVAPLEKAAA